MAVMLKLIKGFETLLRYIRIKKSVTVILGPQYKPNLNQIEIDITWDCNLNCIDCNRLCGWGRTGEYMSVKQIKKFIKESIEQNRKWKRIRVLGGEPTLHPHIFNIINLLLSYKRNFSRNTKIVFCTNGFGLQVNNVLSKITGEIEIENTKKTSIVQEAFESFTIAPADDPLRYKDVDYSNGCWIINKCGVGLTRYGYYPCAVGGTIDRFLGYNIGRKILPPHNDLMQDQLRILCKYCGHFKYTNKKSQGKISPSWQKIYEEYKRKKPPLTLY